jgi:hypothetical protein
LKRLHPGLTYAKAAPILMIFALFSALLVFAATAAAAETLTGESTAPFIEGEPDPQVTIVKGAASFETASGHVVFDVTTAEAPSMSTPFRSVIAGLTTSPCSPPTSLEGTLHQLAFSFPVLSIGSNYQTVTAEATTGSSSALVHLPASKSISGMTTTLSVTSGNLVEAEFKCAVIWTGGSGGGSAMTFPIKPAPEPAPATAPAPATTPATTPAPAPPIPAPPVLSIAKAMPLKVKAGTWKTVHIKVTNTGATATAQGSLRVKAAKGVLVKPEVQKLPIVTPGASFTLSVRVKLTEAAKTKSTLAVTGTAPGITGTGSIVLKLRS